MTWKRRHQAQKIRRTAATGETTETSENCAVVAQSKFDWHGMERQ
jgi:hypothetical protein